MPFRAFSFFSACLSGTPKYVTFLRSKFILKIKYKRVSCIISLFQIIKKNKEPWNFLPKSAKEKREKEEEKTFRKRRLSLTGVAHGKKKASQLRDDVTNRKQSEDVEGASVAAVTGKTNQVFPTDSMKV